MNFQCFNLFAMIFIGSDRRIFMMALRSNPVEDAPGHFVSMLPAINVNYPLCVLGVSRDCIAIYGANATQEGGALIFYNTQFKVIESKQLFKVFFTNSQLWCVDTYIFLAAGQKLAVISFRISKEQLSDMLGSQRCINLQTFVDTECINTDAELEEVLEFDKDASAAAAATAATVATTTTTMACGGDHEMAEPNHLMVQKRLGTFESPDDLLDDLHALQHNDIDIKIQMDDDLLADMADLKLSSNTMSTLFNNRNIHSLVAELERIGESEIAISNLIIPMCIESDSPDDLVVCIRNYSNISEKMLSKSIKYFIDKLNNVTTDESHAEQHRERLNAILSCTFEPELVVEQLRAYLNFHDILNLLNHIYTALTSDERQLEDRPSVCDNDTTDEDILLIKWFTVVLDSHFNQFILSRDTELVEKLIQWKETVDNLLIDIGQSKVISAMLYNLVDSKLMAKENVATKWYSIEEVKLY